MSEPRRWTIYVCPECGRIEGQDIWDAIDLAENGPPACPQSGQHGQLDMEVFEVVEASRLEQPSPTFWPGQNDKEETGPIGDGTPHARMQWFWDRMRGHSDLIEKLTGWSPVSSKYRFEAAIADAFDKLAESSPPEHRLELSGKQAAALLALVEIAPPFSDGEAKEALKSAEIWLRTYIEEKP